jgi:hypothetical protein
MVARCADRIGATAPHRRTRVLSRQNFAAIDCGWQVFGFVLSDGPGLAHAAYTELLVQWIAEQTGGPIAKILYERRIGDCHSASSRDLDLSARAPPARKRKWVPPSLVFWDVPPGAGRLTQISPARVAVVKAAGLGCQWAPASWAGLAPAHSTAPILRPLAHPRRALSRLQTCCARA